VQIGSAQMAVQTTEQYMIADWTILFMPNFCQLLAAETEKDANDKDP